MSIVKITSVIIILFLGTKSIAQETAAPKAEQYGNTLNLGIGLGYYGYVGYATPVLHADYEIGVARNFTLAPFISYYTYRNYVYLSDLNNTYREYYYRETIVPIGVKAFYYFDDLLGAGPRWDFYLGGSLGFILSSTNWDNGYSGESSTREGPGDLFLDFHIGTEYHLNKKEGLFLDLSTGVSTFGLAVHF